MSGSHLVRSLRALAIAALLCLGLVPGLLPTAEAWAQGTGTVAQPSYLQREASGAEEAGAGPSALQRLLFAVKQEQARLHRELAGAIRGLKQGEGWQPLLWLLGISFGYGVFHAAGPGHGKAVVAAYLLTHRSRLKSSIGLASASAMVQALSAIALVGCLAIILDVSQRSVTAQVRTLEIVSYVLVIGIGVWLGSLGVRRFLALRSMSPDAPTKGGDSHEARDRSDHEHGHAAGCGHQHVPILTARTNGDRTSGGGIFKTARQMLPMVLAIGVRPCSGSVIVLLFALANGVFLAGVAAAFAIASGVAITVSALGLASVFGNTAVLRVFRGDAAGGGERAAAVLSIVGAAMICALGALLLSATLQSDRVI